MTRARRAALPAAVLLLVAVPAVVARGGEPFAPAEVESARDAVLALPEFQFDEPPGASSKLTRYLMDALAEMVRFREEYPALFLAIVCVLVVVLIGLLVHIVWTVRASGEGRYRRERIELDEALRRVDPDPFRERALAFAAAGRYEEAVQALYVALLLTLDRRGHVRYARHKALLDYQLEIADRPELRDVLDRFAGTYHPGSFGRRPPDAAHFEELVSALDGVAS